MALIDGPEFYAPWPKYGKKLSFQWGESRVNAETVKILSRSLIYDEDPVYLNSDVAGYEYGELDFHNRFRTIFDKTDDKWKIQYNQGTEAVPVWVDYFSISNNGTVSLFYVSPDLNVRTGGPSGPGAKDYNFVSRLTFFSPHFYLTPDSDGFPTVNLTFDPSQGSGGTITGANNLGGDEGLFAGISGGNTLTFKGLTAGPNITLSSNGTAVTIESTGGGGFYGITAKQSNGLRSYKGLNVLSFESSNFYLTQNTSNTDEVQINFRGSGGSSGEVNTASNLGAGSGIFAQKVGADLQFKSLVAGNNIVLTPSSTEITVATVTDPGFYGVIFTDGISTFKKDKLSFTTSQFYLTPDSAGKPVVGIRDGGIDHAGLANLTVGDPHTQYTLPSGVRPFIGTVGGVTPVAASDLTTKGYVDAVAEAAGPGFYGVTVKQSNNIRSYKGINVLSFESTNFYLTQNSPNTDEVQINFRGTGGGGGGGGTGTVNLINEEGPGAGTSFTNPSTLRFSVPSGFYLTPDSSGHPIVNFEDHVVNIIAGSNITVNNSVTDSRIVSTISAAASALTVNSEGISGGATFPNVSTLRFNQLSGFYLTPDSSGNPIVNWNKYTNPGSGALSERFGLNTGASGARALVLGTNLSTSVDDSILIGASASVTNNFFGGNMLAIGNSSRSGSNSIAIGTNSNSGILSFSSSNVAIGTGATTEGGFISVAIGASATATNTNAFALGGSATATGTASAAIGTAAISSANNAFSLGPSTQITSSASTGAVAVGANVTLTGSALDAIAIGRAISSSGTITNSVIIGALATSTHINTIVLGNSASSIAPNVFTVGSSTSQIHHFYLGGYRDTANPTKVSINVTGGSGTNRFGSDLLLNAGRSTGSARGGRIRLRTSPPGGSGTTYNRLRDQATVDENGVTVRRRLTSAEIVVNSFYINNPLTAGHGLNVPHVLSDPSVSSGGDMWIRPDTAQLKANVGGTVQAISFGGGSLTVRDTIPNKSVSNVTTLKFLSTDFYITQDSSNNPIVNLSKDFPVVDSISFQIENPGIQNYWLDSGAFVAYTLNTASLVVEEGGLEVGFYIRPGSNGGKRNLGPSVTGLDPLECGGVRRTILPSANNVVNLGSELIMSVFYLHSNPKNFRGSLRLVRAS